MSIGIPADNWQQSKACNDGLAVEVQSLEERVETIENAAHAGNLSLQQVGEATPANTITVMSIDHSSGTTGKYVNFDAASVSVYKHR